MVYNFYNAGACVTWPGEADHRRNAVVCGFNVQRPMSEARRTRANWSAGAGSDGWRFAHAQAHAHDAEDAIAFLQIAARIEIARAREIDIDDFLMIAKRCWPIGRRQPI